MAELRPGNNDKAWNDPPVFAYASATSANAVKPTRGRRAYPNQVMGINMSSSPPAIPPSAGIAIPPLTGVLPPMSSSPPVVGSPRSFAAMPPSLAEMDINPKEIWTRLDSEMREITAKADLTDGRKEEIVRRLQAVEALLKEDKVEKSALQLLTRVIEGLEKRDYTAAASAHRSLTIDYPSTASWAIALRNLIAVAKETEDLVFS